MADQDKTPKTTSDDTDAILTRRRFLIASTLAGVGAAVAAAAEPQMCLKMLPPERPATGPSTQPATNPTTQPQVCLSPPPQVCLKPQPCLSPMPPATTPPKAPPQVCLDVAPIDP